MVTVSTVAALDRAALHRGYANDNGHTRFREVAALDRAALHRGVDHG
jgi:hypothetical protein